MVEADQISRLRAKPGGVDWGERTGISNMVRLSRSHGLSVFGFAVKASTLLAVSDELGLQQAGLGLVAGSPALPACDCQRGAKWSGQFRWTDGPVGATAR